MKKLILGLLMLLLLTLNSCENNLSDFSTQKNGPFTTTKLIDTKYKIKIQNYLKKNKLNLIHNSIMKDSIINFNLDDLYLVTFDGVQKTAIVANEENYDPNNDVNFGLSFYQDPVNLQIYKTMIVKTEKVNNNIKNIDYYDSDGTHLLTFQINSETQTVNVTYIISSDIAGKGRLCSGNTTAHCLADVYVNHGWISVWAFVQTGFIPATAAALAIACAYSC